MKTTTYKEFSSNLETYYDTVIEDFDTILVNKEGSSGVVMMSVDEYNSLMETLYLMSSKETMNDIRESEADLRAGKGIEVRLENL